MRIRTAAVPLLGLLLTGLSGLATAAQTHCKVADKFCVTAKASWFGAYSCRATPDGEPTRVCSEHNREGWTFGLSCSGSASGYVTVTVTGCGTSATNNLGAGVSSSWWAWSGTPDICHSVHIIGTFQNLVTETADDTFCVHLS